MRVTAAILAGGEGKRFRPYTEIIPKPMIPIGPDEKPVLEYIIRWIHKHGVKDFVLLVNYKWKFITNYFGKGERFGVTIKYCIDSREYGDTGGALLKAYKHGILSEITLIWYGDILAPLDVSDVLRRHVEDKHDLTLVITNRYKVPVGIAQLAEDGRILSMQEKPELNIHATIGVAVINSDLLGEAEKVLGKKFDFMGDLVPYLIKKGKRVYGYLYDGPWFDIGSLERYKKIDFNKVAKVLAVPVEKDKSHIYD